MKISLIGLGNMGLPIARRLLQAGFPLTIFNRTASRAEPLLAMGAKIAKTPAEAAKEADVVLTMLSDDSATRRVIFGEHGVLSALRPNGIHIALSTISVELSRELTSSHAKNNQTFVAAPVFGRPEAAAEGQLQVVIAGPKQALEICTPLFSTIGQKTWVMSDEPASAHLVKITGNFLLQNAIEGLAESFALIRKAGIAPEIFYELITGTLFSSPVYKNYGKMLLERKYFQDAGFKIPLALKDINLALQSGESLSVPLPTASMIKDQYLTLLGRGGHDLDICALGLLSEENSGLVKQD